jgi:dihydropteroate synthase
MTCGTPQTMQSMTQYKDIVKEILFYFFQKGSQRSLGINDLIIDPGFILLNNRAEL